MPLTGLQIYRLLPRTNCKECGVPTCLAFAMRLAQGQAELSGCPYVSEEAKVSLDAASRPPIRLVGIGTGEKRFEVGNETVLFRHDKTFVHQPGLMVRVKDTDSAEDIQAIVGQVSGYTVERVGFMLAFDGFAVENASGESASFVNCIQAVRSQSDWPLVLMSTDPAAMEAALESEGANRPLIYAATQDNVTAMAELAKRFNCPLAVAASDGLSSLAELSEQVANAGIDDIVLDPGTRGLTDSLEALTAIRRLALQQQFRPLGYPAISFPGEGATSIVEEGVLAGQHIAKYGGVIVLDHFSPEIAYPLLALRFNIYTDPAKPVQVEPGLHAIGEPTADSPLMTTSNYSLTYFAVAGEVESTGAWVLIVDTEGLSLVTSWAAGSYNSETVAKALKAADLSPVAHKNIIISANVAGMSGELEEELGEDWNVMIGPREAADIPSYLRQAWPVKA